MTTLVDRSLDMLLWNSSGRRDLPHRGFSWEDLHSCMVQLGSVHVLVLLNRSMTNLLIASSGISFGLSASINSASVSSGSDFHVDHCRSLSKHGTLVGHMTLNAHSVFHECMCACFCVAIVGVCTRVPV